MIHLSLIHIYAAEVSADKTPTTAASSESNGVSEIHTINVTANRMALLDLDTPAAMDVITQKDLANSGAKNAFDAVNMVPGITSFSYGASGLEYGAMDSRVNIRGLERGSLILMNGVPMNLNGKGGLSSIPTSSIERIEVLKGAASALYGADATVSYTHLTEGNHHSPDKGHNADEVLTEHNAYTK